MAILWCGGEDIDFPNGTVAVTTASGAQRTGYSRSTIQFGSTGSGGSYTQSTQFPGGAVTSAWFTCWLSHASGDVTGMPYAAVSKLGQNVSLGICCSASDATQATLIKYNGATATVLATATNGIYSTGGANHRLDMQIANFGTSATVNMYIDSILTVTYTGDVTLPGFTNFDCIYIGSWSGIINRPGMSEFMVSTTDSRALYGLVTLALTGAGDTNLWTNPTYTNINSVAYSDANPTSSNTVGQDNMYNVTDPPSGTYGVQLVKQSIRATVSAGTATKIKMGYKSGGTIAFGTGSTKTPPSSYGTLEQYDTVNPVTSANWAASDLAPLQLDYQSA